MKKNTMYAVLLVVCAGAIGYEYGYVPYEKKKKLESQQALQSQLNSNDVTNVESGMPTSPDPVGQTQATIVRNDSKITEKVRVKEAIIRDQEERILSLKLIAQEEKLRSEIAGYKNEINRRTEELRRLKNKPLETNAMANSNPSNMPSMMGMNGMQVQRLSRNDEEKKPVDESRPELSAVLNKLNANGTAMLTINNQLHRVSKGSVVEGVRVLNISSNSVAVENTRSKRKRTLYINTSVSRSFSTLQPLTADTETNGN